MLKPIELSVTAPGKSSRGTISPIEACQLGLNSAVPEPIRKVNTSSSQGVSRPISPSTASSSDTSAMPLCAMIITMRRSKLSASAPAAMENTMIGSVAAACTSATILCELVSVVIIQPAPTDCTSPPRLDTSVASHSSRNVSCRNGASTGARSLIITPHVNSTTRPS